MIITDIDKRKNLVKVGLAGTFGDVFEEVLVFIGSIFENLPEEAKCEFARHLQSGVKCIVAKQVGNKTPKTNKDYILSRIEKLDEKPVLSRDEISFICSFIPTHHCGDVFKQNTACEKCVRAWLKEYREEK